MVKASVVVATYNRKEPLARLLETLAKQTVPRDESYRSSARSLGRG